MEKVEMRVVCSHVHDGKAVVPGNVIKVHPDHVADIVRLERAVRKDEKKPAAVAPQKPAEKATA